MKNLVLAFALILFPSLGSAAPILIDDFTALQPPTFSPFFNVDPGILGGERDGDPGFNVVRVDELGLTLEVFEAGVASLTYDGVDGSPENAFGLGGVDLTGGGTNDRFLLDVGAIVCCEDVFELQVRVWEDAGDFLFDIRDVPPENPFNTSARLIAVENSLHEFLFSDFDNGIVGLGNAAAIRLFIFPPFGEASINFPAGTFGAGAAQRPPPVPEPATFLLLGTGLAVVGYRRRRK